MAEFVAIDIGTSFTKGAIVDVASMEIRDTLRRPAVPRMETTDRQHFEFDPERLLADVRDLTSSLLKKSTTAQGVLICGQMGGLVLCDQQSKPLYPYISWLDKRTASADSDKPSVFDHLIERLGNRKRNVLGNEVRPGLTLSSLLWLKEHGQLGDFRNAIPVTLPDFVASALCGTTPVMERTNTPGLLNIAEQSLAVSLFEELGLNGVRWPDVVDFRHCVGEFRCDGRSVPVYAATGDHQCALAGTLLKSDELSINISTGSQVSMMTADHVAGDHQLRPYFDGLMLRTITNIPAGRALAAIVNLLSEMKGTETADADAWRYFFEQAERVKESNLDVSLALFPGAIEGPGHFRNLQEDKMTVGHIARASLEQMAATYERLSRKLAVRNEWSRLAISGGLARKSPFLTRLIGTRFQAPFRVASSAEDALIGLMVLGRVITGLDESVVAATTAAATIATEWDHRSEGGSAGA